ncbi:MAG: hypothetical protein H7222_15045 [Methylotenera sp.]|nr:hypothetical protein [Oligoflexia bacterium]
MNLKDDLVRQAMDASGIKEKAALAHKGLDQSPGEAFSSDH